MKDAIVRKVGKRNQGGEDMETDLVDESIMLDIAISMSKANFTANFSPSIVPSPTRGLWISASGDLWATSGPWLIAWKSLGVVGEGFGRWVHNAWRERNHRHFDGVVGPLYWLESYFLRNLYSWEKRESYPSIDQFLDFVFLYMKVYMKVSRVFLFCCHYVYKRHSVYAFSNLFIHK